MKIRFYLPPNADTIKPERLPNTWHGLTILGETSRLYVEVREEVELLPNNYLYEAEGVSVHDSHTFYYPAGRRSPGLYKLRTATLLLHEKNDQTRGAGQYESLTHHFQTFECEGATLEDVKDLVMRVREGTILPKVSYGKEQVKPLPIEFYDLMKAFMKLIKRDVLRFKTVY